MLPSLPDKWVYGSKLPFQESNVVEFKEVTVFSGLFRDKSLGKSGLSKYRETLLAFLNSGAGYLFMGIKDDGAIVGVENVTLDKLDMLKLWLDSNFNALIYINGKPLDPSKVSLKMSIFPVINFNSSVIVIEARNCGKHNSIMTSSGTIVHRLNASNFKVISEPVYRKRDVKGMISSMRTQIQRIIAEKRRSIEDLKEAHKEELQMAIKNERECIRSFIGMISDSLYERYKLQNSTLMSPFIVDTIKYLLCIR